MSLGYVLRQAGYKMGLNPSDATQREVLLRFANEAAEELYEESDPPNSMMEQAFMVNGDQTISVPYYVGEIRAARELDSHVNWHINKLRPRYNQFNWQDTWRNLRLKNEQALMKSITNESVVVATVKAVENPPVVVTIVGVGNNSSEIIENILMTSVAVSSLNQFTEISAVTKNINNQYDITLTDVAGETLTVIPNNAREARYQIIDVSTCPWLATSQSNTDHYLEILFKKRLPWYEEDAQEFPAQGYDNVWVNKILQLWAEEQEKGDVAMSYDAKASRSIARKKRNREVATEDVVALVSNPHDTLLPRLRMGRRKYGYRYL